jgi:hypothetical protein
MTLVAELGHYFMFLGGPHQRSDFVDRVGKGFLTVKMFPMLDRGHASNGVEMIRRGNYHRIDALVQFVKHFAEIPIALRVGEFVESAGGMTFIDIAQGNNVVAFGDRLQVAGALAANANAGNVDFVVGRGLTAGGYHITGDNSETGDSSGCRGEELATGKCWLVFHKTVTRSGTDCAGWSRFGQEKDGV